MSLDLLLEKLGRSVSQEKEVIMHTLKARDASGTDLQPIHFDIGTREHQRENLVDLQSRLWHRTGHHWRGGHGCSSAKPQHDFKSPQHSIRAYTNTVLLSHGQHPSHPVSPVHLSASLLPEYSSLQFPGSTESPSCSMWVGEQCNRCNSRST